MVPDFIYPGIWNLTFTVEESRCCFWWAKNSWRVCWYFLGDRYLSFSCVSSSSLKDANSSAQSRAVTVSVYVDRCSLSKLRRVRIVPLLSIPNSESTSPAVMLYSMSPLLPVINKVCDKLGNLREATASNYPNLYPLLTQWLPLWRWAHSRTPRSNSSWDRK